MTKKPQADSAVAKKLANHEARIIRLERLLKAVHAATNGSDA